MKPSETSGGFFLQKSFVFLWIIEKHFYLWDMNNTQTPNTMHYTMNDEREYFDTFEFYQYRDNKRCSDDLVGPFTIKGRNKFDAISRAQMMTRGTQCNQTFKCIEKNW